LSAFSDLVGSTRPDETYFNGCGRSRKWSVRIRVNRCRRECSESGRASDPSELLRIADLGTMSTLPQIASEIAPTLFIRGIHSVDLCGFCTRRMQRLGDIFQRARWCRRMKKTWQLPRSRKSRTPGRPGWHRSSGDFPAFPAQAPTLAIYCGSGAALPHPRCERV